MLNSLAQKWLYYYFNADINWASVYISSHYEKEEVSRAEWGTFACATLSKCNILFNVWQTIVALSFAMFVRIVYIASMHFYLIG